MRFGRRARPPYKTFHLFIRFLALQGGRARLPVRIQLTI